MNPDSMGEVVVALRVGAVDLFPRRQQEHCLVEVEGAQLRL